MLDWLPPRAISYRVWIIPPNVFWFDFDPRHTDSFFFSFSSLFLFRKKKKMKKVLLLQTNNIVAPLSLSAVFLQSLSHAVGLERFLGSVGSLLSFHEFSARQHCFSFFKSWFSA